MGGCRCTYRNCTVRSDGKTHLFHYPVFDKMRCNQWLTNAQRYDFLHLKVSQLKNRCICQHHFTDGCFMNSMKDKLKLEAVPTVDGPYCDSSTFETPDILQNTVLYPIPCEDIENDEYISDRKANYNLKYANFLTNCELFEPFKDIDKKKLDKEENKKNTDLIISNVRSVTNILHNANDTVMIHKNVREINVSSQSKEKSSIISEEEQPVPVALVVSKTAESGIGRRKCKINIISEKKITEPDKKIPVPLSTSSFKKVSPSMVLNLDKNKRNEFNDEELINVPKNKTNHEKESTITEILSISDPSNFEIKIDVEEVNPQVPIITHSNKTRPEKEVTLSVSKETERAEVVSSKRSRHYNIKFDSQEWVPLSPKKTPKKKTVNVVNKSKISAERLAAINEKRKFNMKLKDIIEAGLNQLDTQETDKSEFESPGKKILNSESETVATSLSKESKLPGHTDYIISYLEARMRKMENLLLNKIDQNTQKIMELKGSFDPPESQEPGARSSKISTRNKNIHNEAHKRQLFKEISKYLTPNANSLVYEELFINKYKPHILNTDCQPPKKRKRRSK